MDFKQTGSEVTFCSDCIVNFYAAIITIVEPSEELEYTGF